MQFWGVQSLNRYAVKKKNIKNMDYWDGSKLTTQIFLKSVMYVWFWGHLISVYANGLQKGRGKKNVLYVWSNWFGVIP